MKKHSLSSERHRLAKRGERRRKAAYLRTIRPRLFSTAGACDYLGCSRSRLYELRKLGLVRTVKDGASTKWVGDSLDEYADSLEAV